MTKTTESAVKPAANNFKYIAILGRQPEFGLAELESVVGAEGVKPFGRAAALVNRELDIDRLGGAVKLGAVAYDGPTTPLDALPLAAASLPLAASGKTSFAISVYGGGSRVTRRAVEAAGLTLKKALRERLAERGDGGSVRLVVPKDGTEVSAAALKGSWVVEDGFELLVVLDGPRMIVALTYGVQDVDWYSKRDYDRPARSAVVGMLPPKLAQILVNTTSASTVVDPFCGTGVVLQEALLNGRAAVGSDLSPEMVEASRKNLTWLSGAAGRALPSWNVELADAKQVLLPDLDIAVVSEGYLGPNLSTPPAPAELAKIQVEMLDLYRSTLKNFARQLEPGTEIALCVPAWRQKSGWSYLNLIDDLPRLGYTIKALKHVRGQLLYARPDQVVGRQILLLRKS